MADNKSNTMELDSILEEARTRRLGSSAPAQRPDAPAGRQSAPVQRDAAPANSGRNLNDDFIFTDDNGQTAAPQNNYRPRPQYDYDSAPKKPRKKKKVGLIVTLCIVGVLLIAGGAGLLVYMNSGEEEGPQGTFSDNVYVNGKSLKDLTMDEAKTMLASVEKEMADGIKVTVKAGDKTYDYTKDDFEYTFNTDDVLNEAKAYSEEKGFKTEDQNYEIKMTVKDTTCKDLITKIAEDIKTDPQDAQVTAFDPDADSMFTIEDGKKGVSLDEETSLKAFTTFIDGGNTAGTVDATTKEVDPTYTKADLEGKIVELSHFSTISTNNSNGNENMRVSLAACNGSIIDPGETWSFNDCTGDSNQESNGYKPAGVIVEGRSETGVGGGICQSSTTIYNACILCGMDVVERECHYYKSVYVDAGRDATVDYGNIDLKVENPFKYQLFMKCWMDGTELNCSIYGLENPEFDDIEISTTSPSYFGNGYKVETTRTYYKGDTEVKSDELPSSTYYTSAPSSGGSSGGGSYSNDDDDSGDYSDAGGGGGDSGGGEEAAGSGGEAAGGGGEAAGGGGEAAGGGGEAAGGGE